MQSKDTHFESNAVANFTSAIASRRIVCFILMVNLLVTGAAGFVGRHLCDRLDSYRRENTKPSHNERIEISSIATPTLRIGDFAPEHLRNVHLLVHLAAHGVNPNNATWEDCFRVNVQDTLRLFQLAAEAGCRKWLAVGSYSEYGKPAEQHAKVPANSALFPTGPYATSKASCGVMLSGLAKSLGASLTYARLFSIFGTGQSDYALWPSLLLAAREQRDFPLTLGEHIRDFTPIEYAVDTLVRELAELETSPHRVKVINVGSGIGQTVADFSRSWWHRWNATGQLRFGELPTRHHEPRRTVADLTPHYL